MTRRELAKFLTLGSGLLASVNPLIAFIGLTGRVPPRPSGASPRPTSSRRAARSVPLSDYDDPCILVRDAGRPRSTRSRRSARTSPARSCIARRTGAGVPVPSRDRFPSVDGRPLAGPPTRRLPRILIEQRGDDLVATGIEV